MSGKRTLEIEASLDHLEEIRGFVESSARDAGVDDPAISDLVLAVDEAVTNIIIHGYRNQSGKIEISSDNRANSIVICLKDQAPEFDPCSYLSMDLEATLEKDTPGGFGLHLIKKTVDDLKYHVNSSGGNELFLVKHYSE